jgi:hypothetical protein
MSTSSGTKSALLAASLLVNPGDTTFLLNVGKLPPDYTSSQDSTVIFPCLSLNWVRIAHSVLWTEQPGFSFQNRDYCSKAIPIIGRGGP